MTRKILFACFAFFFLFIVVSPVKASGKWLCTCKDSTKPGLRNGIYEYDCCSGENGCVKMCADHGGVGSCTSIAGGDVTAITADGADTSETVSLDNPLCPAGSPDCVTPQSLIGKIINSILGIVGSLALLMFVYGGFTWMTSSGNQEKVKKGKDIIIWSIIGLVIIFSSYALTKILINSVKQ